MPASSGRCCLTLILKPVPMAIGSSVRTADLKRECWGTGEGSHPNLKFLKASCCLSPHVMLTLHSRFHYSCCACRSCQAGFCAVSSWFLHEHTTLTWHNF